MGSSRGMFAGTIFILSLLTFGVCGTDSKTNPCPAGWLDATHVSGGCLLFNSTNSIPCLDANKYCQEYENTRLLEIHSILQLENVIMELEILEQYVGKKFWWTGGNDIGFEGNWTWIQSNSEVGEFIWYHG